jgi:dCMP deaminase
MYKGILESVEQSSTCGRLQVGALIVKDGRVISMGWNGVPSGQDHCDDHFSKKGWDVSTGYLSSEHHKYATRNEIHAEQNAIAYAAKSGISTNGAEIYITYSPCRDCAKLVVAAGIKEVYFTHEYDRDCEGVEFLKRNNITVDLV